MPARAFAIPLAAAVIGGGVTAGVLVGTGAVGQRKTTTIVQQAPLTSASPASESRAGGLTARDIYGRDAPASSTSARARCSTTQSPFDVFPRTQENLATGSGFVLDDNGDILTNAHVGGVLARRARVVLRPSHGLRARGRQGRRHRPRGAGRRTPRRSGSTRSRSATPAPSGSATRRVAIGNPFGLERTLTTGVVSALQRRITAPERLRDRATSSRPTRRSTPATPAARCSTPPAA